MNAKYRKLIADEFRNCVNGTMIALHTTNKHTDLSTQRFYLKMSFFGVPLRDHSVHLSVSVSLKNLLDLLLYQMGLKMLADKKKHTFRSMLLMRMPSICICSNFVLKIV